jgi:bifunctional NMN adenylyltransferase/nudix hydrolase
MQKKRLAVVIMRAQLPTQAHFSLLQEAAKIADHTLILLGSSNLAPSVRNPFSFAQRKEMIQLGMGAYQVMTSHFAPLPDFPTDFEWEAQVLHSIQKTKNALDITDDSEVTIVAHEKDETSYYVHSFPQLALTLTPSFGDFNATEARERLISGSSLEEYTHNSVVNWIEREYKSKPREPFGFDWLVQQHLAVSIFQKPYLGLPYGINFITGDALVICGSYILLIERSGSVGKGQLALPGGFKDPGENIRKCIERELFEETVIDVPKRALRLGFAGMDVFSAQGRDPRGDFTTFCGVYVIEPNADGKPPKVKGASDATKAVWLHLADLKDMSRMMFADHAIIIETQMRKYA